jgi:hypothetical protein
MEVLAPGARRQEAQQGAGKAARSPKGGSPSATCRISYSLI